MKRINTFSILSLALALAGFITIACAEQPKTLSQLTADKLAIVPEQDPSTELREPEAWPEVEDRTIVGVASDNEDFSTLVAALGAADLVATLQTDGPFTVFAPTNAAFEKLPEGTVASLLEDVNKPKLVQILTYHVVPGKFVAEDVIAAIKENNNAFPIETVEGSVLTLSLENGAVVLTDVAGNTSTVAQADVAASNGVIHVIDTVVMP